MRLVLYLSATCWFVIVMVEFVDRNVGFLCAKMKLFSLTKENLWIVSCLEKTRDPVDDQ
jgi:hypothetical protein